MISDRISTLIIKSFLYNEEYARKCLPYVQEEYFKDSAEKYLIKEIKQFIETYNNLPTKEALLITANKDDKISENVHKNVTELIKQIEEPEVDYQFLITETEAFCQEMALQNAILDSVTILNKESKTLTKDAIPDIVKEALSVSFDPHVGHDYILDYQERWDHYHAVEEKIPFDLQYFNRVTGGGTPRKTLNIILAGTNVGKSLAMCHMATANIQNGNNVLYITLEISEEEIAKRIDCNLLNVPITELKEIPEQIYKKKLENLKEKIVGKLIIKEYPTSTAGASNFRALLNELKLKKNFVPDIIYIDYLNLCSSSRFRSDNSNSYQYFKCVAEELRGLAVEQNLPIWTATQTNREGFKSSDFGLEQTSESFGLPMTADFMIAMITSEKLAQMNKVMIKQLKSRYGDVGTNKRFLLGIDKLKMRLYNLDDDESTPGEGSGSTNSSSSSDDDTPAFDKSAFGQGMKAERRNSFDDWDF